MDLANRLSGLDMHLYNAEDGPYQSDPTTGADGEWEVVSQHPEWDFIPRGNVQNPRGVPQREALLHTGWVACEKGLNGEVHMFESLPAEDRDASSTSTEEGDQTSVSRPRPAERDTTRAGARPDARTAWQKTDDSTSGVRVVDSQTPPSGLSPSRQSYERVRPVNKARAHALRLTADDEARGGQKPHAPPSIPIRISTSSGSRIAKPTRNPNINRPLSPDEKELPFLTARPAAAGAGSMSRHKHCQIAAQLREQAGEEQAALRAEQRRMDARLERSERAVTNWYGLPHGQTGHFH
ncbi:uncharacterized protein Z520_03253 [Fonsecaea multimorphosa CBS 102226]|uniref:Uncharacterized protein n=1 Tax=Fonsecaea multimorphosa CBS 102226 TaxID=1442371 RepID=A0A0D2KBW6_9EURO|nr:uncharacterized protein Z520_03253 [Fonsecaea multimorphosa CBS 102226]KIY00590.1 hypothetical protein Z520_03253 [Fonsecaea multimorphosa CBS 102226]OAL18982.1 hypothetical protein AYO22_10311 [Fonsecaea multimorphosa]